MILSDNQGIKVLRAGASWHGGEHEWSLPTRDASGAWTPGEWTPRVAPSEYLARFQLAREGHGQAVLVTDGLPPAPQGRTYQVWYLGADGSAAVAAAIHAGGGRVTSLHYGTYDYSASLGVSAE